MVPLSLIGLVAGSLQSIASLFGQRTSEPGHDASRYCSNRDPKAFASPPRCVGGWKRLVYENMKRRHSGTQDVHEHLAFDSELVPSLVPGPISCIFRVAGFCGFSQDSA